MDRKMVRQKDICIEKKIDRKIDRQKYRKIDGQKYTYHT